MTTAKAKAKKIKGKKKRYRMIVVDLTNGEHIEQSGRVSKRVAIEIMRNWPARQLNALVFFVPDWAKVSISCDPIGAFDSHSTPIAPR